jgi:hypothetical protein
MMPPGLFFFLIVAAPLLATADQDTGRVLGTILSPAGGPLPGVVLILSAPGETETRLQVSGSEGEFAFEGLPDGVYSLVATLPGYEDKVIENLSVEGGEDRRVDFSLSLIRFSETVVIRDVAPGQEIAPAPAPAELSIAQLDLLPLATDQFQEAFPLLPGVVRDPEGRLSFNGARPSQSILLVNGANVTDPVTGDFAVDLPLRAIEAVEVNELPYSAEYGRVTGAVAEVKTRGGTDEWDVDTGDLLPKLNFRDGKIQGIRAFVPQIGVSGPLKKGKAWISQGLAYRFVRTRVYDVDSGEDERVLESWDTFTQLDWRMAPNHHLTTTFSYFPVETDNLGLTALLNSSATPEYHSSGWNAAISERSRFGDGLLETSLAVKRFDLSLMPKDTVPSVLTPDGLQQNYFNHIDRESSRVDLSAVFTRPLHLVFRDQILKLGGDFSRSRFEGIDAGLPIMVLDGSGSPLRRIDFEGDPRMDGSDLQVSGFVQNRLRLTDRLGLEVGLRYDYDRMVSDHQLAPRLAAAYALDARGRTVVKGGFGVFYDHVFLHADSFERFQSRIETAYGADGLPLGAPIVFRNRVAWEELSAPRSTTWNLELDRFLTELLELRIGYRERRGTKELIVDRIVDGSEGALVLSSTGRSFSREFGVTLRIADPGDRELFFAYAKSRSTGDLNNFGTLYRNLRSPLIFQNEDSLFDLDVPHRLLLWGVWTLPADIKLAPGIEWRSGFPYTIYDEAYVPVGERNRGGRFPEFLSLDVRVTKGITVKGRRVRVGFQIFNLGSHFNPRDVVSNLGSPRFGQFLNSVDMGIAFRFSLGAN